MECPTPTVAAVLDGIERQLTEAAELVLTGQLSETLHAATLTGALLLLPRPLAPGHIPVLQRLKRWKDLELFPPELHEQLQRDIIAQSRPAEAGESSSAASQQPAATTAPPSAATTAPPSAAIAPVRPSHAKKQKLGTQQQTLYSMMPDATRTRVPHQELKRQREAAANGEDYELEGLDMRRFRKEIKGEPAPAVVKIYPCDKCARTFGTPIALINHSRSHGADVQPKTFFPPATVALPAPDLVGLNFMVDAEGVVSVGLTFEGLAIADAMAEQEQAERRQQEREAARSVESKRRQRLREAQDAAEEGEHRSGSAHRRSYTAKQRLKYLEVFDDINADASKTLKMAAFEADPRAKGCPYTTCKGWSAPKERARISAAAGKEHAATLLRIDKKSRQVGRFAEAENALVVAFKARRARGRKVSARWLTAMMRQLVRIHHPEHADSFKGGPMWRRRLASRFKLSVRRKTNAKNKTWADTEPILLRYLRTLRRRLQLDSTEGQQLTREEQDAVEPEPDDVSPALEELAAAEEESDCSDDAALDSEDEHEEGDELISLEEAMPSGYEISPPPLEEQLMFRGERAVELVGRRLLFNWAAVGWLEGEITAANTDARRKIKVGPPPHLPLSPLAEMLSPCWVII
jgi:hypothetical protein